MCLHPRAHDMRGLGYVFSGLVVKGLGFRI
jgi:hypothetical protein